LGLMVRAINTQCLKEGQKVIYQSMALVLGTLAAIESAIAAGINELEKFTKSTPMELSWGNERNVEDLACNSNPILDILQGTF
jgi:hypothetical protein